MSAPTITRKRHPMRDTQPRSALPGPTSPAANDAMRPTSGAPLGNQPEAAVRGPILRDPLLSIMADAVDDLETVRIASENRYRALTRAEADSDGETRGFGLTDAVPEVARQRGVVDGLVALEHQAVLNLQRQMRKHPLWTAYGKVQKGIGEKQFARLLAVVGDPYWNDLHDRPRIVSELWAYCGYHVITSGGGQASIDTQVFSAAAGSASSHPTGQCVSDAQCAPAGGVAVARRRGQRANWNADARMRTYLIAESCMRAGGPYRAVYDAGREKYADATHAVPCTRCGPSGKPAPVGSPLSAGHQHARALRIVSKTILRDLWVAARDLRRGA